jgi:hypothetical protein
MYPLARKRYGYEGDHNVQDMGTPQVAARYCSGQFWSDDPALRAGVDGWMDWSQTALQPDFLGGVFWGFYRTPEDKRNWPAINAALAALREGFRQARPAAGRPQLPARRDLVARRHHGRDLAVSLFRAGNRASEPAAGRTLVSHAAGARSLPDPHHGPVRGIARAVGLLRVRTHRSVRSRSDRCPRSPDNQFPHRSENTRCARGGPRAQPAALDGRVIGSTSRIYAASAAQKFWA